MGGGSLHAVGGQCRSPFFIEIASASHASSERRSKRNALRGFLKNETMAWKDSASRAEPGEKPGWGAGLAEPPVGRERERGGGGGRRRKHNSHLSQTAALRGNSRTTTSCPQLTRKSREIKRAQPAPTGEDTASSHRQAPGLNWDSYLGGVHTHTRTHTHTGVGTGQERREWLRVWEDRAYILAE